MPPEEKVKIQELTLKREVAGLKPPTSSEIFLINSILVQSLDLPPLPIQYDTCFQSEDQEVPQKAVRWCMCVSS